jgi:hypothetical protein
MFAKSPAGMAAQTRTLLNAVRGASTGTDRSRKHLASLATTLNTGRFKENRFDSEINAIARSLAAFQAHGADQPEPVQRTLRELRDTLDALLD